MFYFVFRAIFDSKKSPYLAVTFPYLDLHGLTSPDQAWPGLSMPYVDLYCLS